MFTSPLTVLIIDDEQSIREVLYERLSESNLWDVVGQAASVSEAIKLITKLKPQVLFLDIKIREGDAFHIIETLLEMDYPVPSIVMNTGFADFNNAQRALNEFSDYIVTLLKKPFWLNWNTREIEIYHKIMEKIDDDNEPRIMENKLIIRSHEKTFFVTIDEIIFCEVESPGSAKTKIVLEDEVIIYNRTLARMTDVLPNYFIQISRHAIVNLNKIRSFDHHNHQLQLEHIDRLFDVGNAYRKNLNL